MFFQKDIKKRFGVTLHYTKKWYISLDFSEWFSLMFSQNPGLPDIYALYGYIMHYVPKSWDIVIDAGWYHWLCALYFAKLVGPTGRVIVFEPDTKNMAVLRKNMALNDITNLVLIPKWLWSTNTQLSFLQTGEMYSTLGESTPRSPDTKATTLDVVNPLDECKILGFDHVDFIKMDIEWAEIEVLQWISQQLKTYSTHFAIASYHIMPDTNDTTSGVLEELFKKVWYHAETGWPEHTTTFAWKH